jgi:hypothetical protein
VLRMFHSIPFVRAGKEETRRRGDTSSLPRSAWCPDAAEASSERIESWNAQDRQLEARDGPWDGLDGGEPSVITLPPVVGSLSCAEYEQEEDHLSRFPLGVAGGSGECYEVAILVE